MIRLLRCLVVGTAALFSVTVQADCGLQYQACEKVCQVKYLTDDAAEAGCVSKCVAERGVCLTKAGAEKAVDVGEKAWDSTKSFIQGLTDKE